MTQKANVNIGEIVKMVRMYLAGKLSIEGIGTAHGSKLVHGCCVGTELRGRRSRCASSQ